MVWWVLPRGKEGRGKSGSQGWMLGGLPGALTDSLDQEGSPRRGNRLRGGAASIFLPQPGKVRTGQGVGSVGLATLRTLVNVALTLKQVLHLLDTVPMPA